MPVGDYNNKIMLGTEITMNINPDFIKDYLVANKNDYSQLNGMSRDVHRRNTEAGWWTDPTTGEDLHGFKEGPEIYSNAKRDLLNLLCLVHSEVSEACEGVRKNLQDDKLPHRSMLEVELADTIIRIFDIAGAHNLDLGGAIWEKLNYNANREDHRLEHRLSEGGKKF